MDITHYYHYLPFILIGLLLFMISYFLSILLSSLGIFFYDTAITFSAFKATEEFSFSLFLSPEGSGGRGT